MRLAALSRIGDSTGSAGSASVQLNAANQIPDTATVTVQPDGQLNLQSYAETIGATRR